MFDLSKLCDHLKFFRIAAQIIFRNKLRQGSVLNFNSSNKDHTQLNFIEVNLSRFLKIRRGYVNKCSSFVLTANSQHVNGGFVQLDEDTVVDLPQPEELESLLHLRGNLVDTTNTDDEGVLVLSLDMESTLLLGLTDKADILALNL